MRGCCPEQNAATRDVRLENGVEVFAGERAGGGGVGVHLHARDASYRTAGKRTTASSPIATFAQWALGAGQSIVGLGVGPCPDLGGRTKRNYSNYNRFIGGL